MGNSCCTGGELKHELAYNSRPKNQDQNAYDANPNLAHDDKILLAYSSNDRKQMVKIESNARGD